MIFMRQLVEERFEKTWVLTTRFTHLSYNAFPAVNIQVFEREFLWQQIDSKPLVSHLSSNLIVTKEHEDLQTVVINLQKNETELCSKNSGKISGSICPNLSVRVQKTKFGRNVRLRVGMWYTHSLPSSLESTELGPLRASERNPFQSIP